MEYNGAKKRDFHQNYTSIVVFSVPILYIFCFQWSILLEFLLNCVIVETSFSCNSTNTRVYPLPQGFQSFQDKVSIAAAII